MYKNCKYFIGADSGGSKCDIVITDVHLKEITSKSFKSVHLSEKGTKIFADSLIFGIKNAINKRKINSENILGICIGAAGARSENVKKSISGIISKSLNVKNVITISDTEAAIQGVFGEEDGLVLICGTGSILYGRVNNKIFRIGGWGKIIGDNGSGYDIGRKALMKLVRGFDLNSGESLFSVKIRKKYGMDKSTLIKKVYHENFKLQTLAPLVIECAALNDKICKDVVKEAVDEMLYLIDVFFKIARRRNKIKLALIGSVIENENYFSHMLKVNIRKKFAIKVKIVKSSHKPAYGSVLLAKNVFGS